MVSDAVGAPAGNGIADDGRKLRSAGEPHPQREAPECQSPMRENGRMHDGKQRDSQQIPEDTNLISVALLLADSSGQITVSR